MKLGLFSDPHYSSAAVTCGKRYNSKSLVKMEKAFRFFQEQKCDMVIILGDLTDHEPNHAMEEENMRRALAVMDQSGMETICLMGNHDAFLFTSEEFYTMLGKGREPRLISRNGLHLLFLDACYYRSGQRYQPGKIDWTDTFYPHAEELQKQLNALEGDVYVFMHQNIDPLIREDHRLHNDAQIRRILEQSGKVRTVWQGHYHPGHEAVVNDIRYVTLPAMCENEDAFFIAELPEG